MRAGSGSAGGPSIPETPAPQMGVGGPGSPGGPEGLGGRKGSGGRESPPAGPTSWGVAAAGVLATLLSAIALLPVIDGSGWYLRAVGAVLLVAGAGEFARRQGFPRLLVPLVQLAVLTGWLTFLVAREQALLGVLPGLATWVKFLQVAQAGVIDAGQYAPPVPEGSALAAFAIAGVGVVGLLVDLFAATLRLPALAGLALFVPYAVSLSVVEGTHPGPFALIGAGYLVLLLAGRRDRLGRYGRFLGWDTIGRDTIGRDTIGRDMSGRDASGRRAPMGIRHGRWHGRWHGWGQLTRTGGQIGAVVLAATVLLPALLPDDLTGGLVSPSDLLTRAAPDHRAAGPPTIETIDPTVSLYRDLNTARNVPLLRVRTQAVNPRGQYLRLATLDRFDGAEWKPAKPDPEAVPDSFETARLSEDLKRRPVKTTIQARSNYRSRWLALPQPATSVNLRGDWRYDPQSGDIMGAVGQTTAGVSYTVTSLAKSPTANQLRLAASPPRRIAEHYTKVPDDLAPIVGKLARRVTKGAATPYGQAMALQEWFLDPEQFSYDTSVKSGQTDSPMAQFLHDRVGYCQQFAGTMAAMARVLGIPARVAVGFTPGVEQADGSFLIGTHDAHAWPELYFEGAGWVRFEPTPTIDFGRGSAPSWATPSRAQENVPSPSVAAPEVAPRDRSVDPIKPEPRLEDQTATGTVAASDPAADLPLRGLAYAAAAGLILLVASIPWQSRAYIRRRRMRADPDPARRARAAWAEVRDEARDLGYPWQDAVTVRQAATRLGDDAALEPAGADALGRIVRRTERARYASAPPAVGDDSLTDVAVVRDALATRRGRPARWRARVLPPTVFGFAPRVARRLMRVVARGYAKVRSTARR